MPGPEDKPAVLAKAVFNGGGGGLLMRSMLEFIFPICLCGVTELGSGVEPEIGPFTGPLAAPDILGSVPFAGTRCSTGFSAMVVGISTAVKKSVSQFFRHTALRIGELINLA